MSNQIHDARLAKRLGVTPTPIKRATEAQLKKRLIEYLAQHFTKSIKCDESDPLTRKEGAYYSCFDQAVDMTEPILLTNELRFNPQLDKPLSADLVEELLGNLSWVGEEIAQLCGFIVADDFKDNDEMNARFEHPHSHPRCACGELGTAAFVDGKYFCPAHKP